jgi:thiamine biosynthesis lipoprotein
MLQAAGAAALLAACGDPRRALAIPGLHTLHGLAMGSAYTVKLYAPGISTRRLDDARDAVAAAFDGVVAKMSTFDPDSELSRFNRHEATTPFAVSGDTFQVFEIAREVSEASHGAFDVTVAPSVNAWGFGPDKTRRVPADGAQRTARERIGYAKLVLDSPSRAVAKRAPDVTADFSGIAQGYGAELAARALDALGFDRYMVDMSGEIRTRGLNADGRGWQIAIERPQAMPRRAHRIVPVADASLATSGDYRIFFEQDGRRYSHEIDPATGAPVTHALASVSVVTPDCARADAWATALFVLGPDRGYALAAARGLAAHFIVREAPGVLVDRSTPAFAAIGGGLA